jgi:CRP-like cAMP-binding protein
VILNHENSIGIIGNAIIKNKNSYQVNRKKHQRFNLNDMNSICFLDEGSVSAYRIYDNALSMTFKAPAILGLAQMRHSESYYMRCASDSKIWQISSEDAQELFTENDLWIHAFDILTSHIHIYYQRERLDSLPNVKAKVVEILHSLWSEGDEVHTKNSIYSYIQKRMRISRSAIHKAIKELSVDGLIETKRGRLTFIKSQDIFDC